MLKLSLCSFIELSILFMSIFLRGNLSRNIVSPEPFDSSWNSLFNSFAFVLFDHLYPIENGYSSRERHDFFQIITAFLDIFFVCWIDSQNFSASA
jgi:hypothetical protein